MNKRIKVAAIALLVVVAASVSAYVITRQHTPTSVLSAPEKHIRIVAEKNGWAFSPDTIEVSKGDHVFLEVVNEDDFEHGLAIDGYDVSQMLPGSATTNVDFVADKPGEFRFYCFIPCGNGETAHGHRGHADMKGLLVVK